jgi:LuxR family transcriptional regulator, maltose regulon positive regulatory protein
MISLDQLAKEITIETGYHSMDHRQGEYVTNTTPGSVGETEKDQTSMAQSRHLLRTKFFVPPIRSSQIARPRLSDLLDSSLDRALILVSAPAGYGKTTLVSSWLKEKRIPAAWLSLDDGDNDPIRFLQYLVGTLATLVSSIEAEAPGMLQTNQPSQVENVINLIVNELASFPEPFVLVLDDFHVIHSESVTKILAYSLEHLPPQMHMALLSRTDPPLPLSRLRARNKLTDIRLDQLRFTRDETAAFLNDVMGLKLSADDLSAMETRTEGWIAGLQLAALSMQNSKDIHTFVSAFTGSHHYVMDYLVEEVLKSQPQKTGAFLLQTSILDKMCAGLCESVIDANPQEPVDGQATLEALEKMNLFVIPLDDERRWYRYHHLFADVLRKRLEQHHPGALPELNQRASQWFEQNGLIPEAVRHALTAGDQDRVIRMIEQYGAILVLSGEYNALSTWIKAVEPRSQMHPWIHIIKAWLFILTGQPERAEELLQIAEKLISPLEVDTQNKLMLGAIATGRAYRSFINGDPNQTATFARQAVEDLPDVDIVSRSIRSIATALLGDACLMIGEFEQARKAYAEAVKIGKAAGDVHVVMVVDCSLGRIFMEQGLLHQAAELFAEALQMATRPDGKKLVTAGEVFAELCQLSYEWNNLETTSEQVHSCISLCRQWGHQPFQAIGSIMLAHLEQVQGHPEAALEAMNIAENLTREHHFAFKYTVWVKHALVRLWIAQGNLEKASQVVQESGISIEDEISFLRDLEFLALLRLLLAQGDYESALVLSQRILKKVETARQMRRMIEVLVLQALIFQGRKELDQSLEVLKKALSLGRTEGYIRTFVDEGEPMAKLLHLARSRQIEPEYAADLLSAFERGTGKPHSPSQFLIDPLTIREIEVLRLIEAGCSNQDIAGKLVISIPTVKRHISNIYAKLGVESRTQAVAIGKELKLFE